MLAINIATLVLVSLCTIVLVWFYFIKPRVMQDQQMPIPLERFPGVHRRGGGESVVIIPPSGTTGIKPKRSSKPKQKIMTPTIMHDTEQLSEALRALGRGRDRPDESDNLSFHEKMVRKGKQKPRGKTQDKTDVQRRSTAVQGLLPEPFWVELPNGKIVGVNNDATLARYLSTNTVRPAFPGIPTVNPLNYPVNDNITIAKKMEIDLRHQGINDPDVIATMISNALRPSREYSYWGK